MKVVNRGLLVQFIELHPDSEAALRTWLSRANQAEWRTPHDVRQTFSSASLVHGGNRWVFDIRQNRYRLDAKIDYVSLVCLIKRLGTHKEYDSWRYDQ